jgi:hypothetical protein
MVFALDYLGDEMKSQIFAFALLLVFGSPTVASDELTSVVADLSAQREQAYSLVHEVMEQKKVGRLKTSDAKAVKQRYDAAQAAVNGWLDGVALDVSQGGRYEKNRELQNRADLASEKIRSFLVFARDKTARNKGGIPIKTVLAIGGFLADMAIKAYKAYNDIDPSKRDALLKQLSQQRWSTFEDISKA